MRPEDVGFARTDLVLGKHSGRAALGDRAAALGYTLSPEQLQTVFEQFKVLADKKKEIYDSDIASLIEHQMGEVPELWSFVSYEVRSGTNEIPKATLTLRRGDEEISRELAEGDGPIDVIFLATEQITGVRVVCKEFQVHSVSIGKDAQADVTVEVEYQGQLYRGRAVSTDSIEASARAFLVAINRIAAKAGRPLVISATS
jgi:2-isopropylmalate synthase